MNSVQQLERKTEPHAGGITGVVRAWRYLFIVLAIGVAFGLFYAEENWRGERAWARYQREMAARGEPLDAKAFIPPSAPDSENFAMTPLLAPLFQFLPGTQKPRDTNAIARLQNFAPRFDAASRWVKPPKLARSNSWLVAKVDLPLWQGAFLAATNTDYRGETLLATNFTPEQAAQGILDALSESEPVFEELRVASRLKYSRFDLRYQEENPAGILLPHLSGLKHLCEVAQLKASAELALRRTDKAFDDVQLILSLADATRTEPILISQLVRGSQLQIAFRPLAEGMGQWSEPQLRALQERLLRFDFCADMKYALKGERAWLGAAMIDYVRRSPGRLNMIAGPSATPDGMSGALWNLIPSGWFYQEQVNYCQVFDQFLLPAIDVEKRRIQPVFVKQATADLGALIGRPGPSLFLRHRFFAALMVPALSRVSQKTAFLQTAAETTAVACALERFRLARGELPDSLDRLTPEFIAKLPHDIITGESLKYRRGLNGDYVLYSVGWNETDEAGQAGQHRLNEGNDLSEADWVWRPL